MDKADPGLEQAELKSLWTVLPLSLLLRWPVGGFGVTRVNTHCAWCRVQTSYPGGNRRSEASGLLTHEGRQLFSC